MICLVLGNETHSIDYKDPSGTVVHQTLQFNAFNPNENPRALKLQVRAHDNFQDVTMIMHASSSGYWHHASLKVWYIYAPLMALNSTLEQHDVEVWITMPYT